LNYSRAPYTEIGSTSFEPFLVKNNSPLSCLHQWDINTFEVVGLDVDDVSSRQQTRS
jgi:hypothetical protein